MFIIFQNFGIALESMFLRSTDRCQFADVLFRIILMMSCE